MKWGKCESGIFIPKYEYTGTNQHGDRYKKIESIVLPTLTLSVDVAGATTGDLKQLILLGSSLDIAPKYDFDEPQSISIRLLSATALQAALNK